MGGCGKTQVALEYCRQGQNMKWFSAIFWFDASTPASMAQSFSNAADKLSKPNFDAADVKGNVRFVLNAVETRNIHWLLIFDNFDDPSAFGDENIKDYFPRGAHASILFTTRHAGVKDMGLSIDVTSMLDKEALDLLLNRSHAERSDANMQEGANIVKRLGYHALAIDQAGAYIKAGGLDICLYMEHYTERKEKVLSEIPELWDYQRRLKTDSETMIKLTVFTTWELSVQLITGTPTEQKDKIHILTLAAFLDSKEVSDDLFAWYGSQNIDWLVSCVTDGAWDRYEAQTILKELRKLSLLQNVHIGKNGTTFSLHPLIQDWVKLRVKLDVRRAFAVEAILLISTFLENHHILEMTLKTRQALLSHLEVVLQNENTYKVLQGDIKGTKLQDATSYFGQFFRTQGRYNSSEQMIRQELRWKKKILGKEHLDTLQNMNTLGVALRKQGKYDEAVRIHQRTFELQEKVLGIEHPDTLRSMNYLGVTLSKQKNYDQAEQINRQVLQLRQKILGNEHHYTLESMNNVGTSLQKRGKYDEAERMYQKTLQIQEKVLGNEHPGTLQTMNNLAIALRRLGKYDDAEQIHRQTLRIRKKTLGNEHPDTLRTMNNLGVVLKTQGKYDEAKLIHQETLDLRKKVLGEGHPDTLESMNNLGVVLETLGKYDEAKLIYQETLDLRKKVLGEGHPDTLESMRNLESSRKSGQKR
jgi:tetratricopeptide (TPR) repeat protein